MKMKSKKEKDIEARKKHREQLKKDRRSSLSLERNIPSLIEKPTILIVCEGENTEPSYFNKFKLSSATVKPIGEALSAYVTPNDNILMNKQLFLCCNLCLSPNKSIRITVIGILKKKYLFLSRILCLVS